MPNTSDIRTTRDEKNRSSAFDRFSNEDSSTMPGPSADFGLNTALAQLQVRYRRPLLQIFLQRRIAPDVAQDLLQQTLMQAIEIHTEGVEASDDLGRHLYETACQLAGAYWRGEWDQRWDANTEDLANLCDEALSLEERVDHEALAKCVRTLMMHLPMARDREVLLRFYVNGESRESICESMDLSNLQFNQLLCRARQRFGETLRKNGVSSAQ